MDADLAFVNGAVFCADAARRWARAVVVERGRFSAVGTDEEIRGHIGPGTEVIDLAGRMLVPGFQDAHVHPVSGGQQLLRCDLSDLAGRAEYLEEIARYARQNPDLAWVTGGGWSMGAFPGGTPRRKDLDAVVPDRPVFLTNRDGHGAWVNGAALELAGVDAATPDPPDGRVERDADGAPAGTLQEGAMHLVERHIPPATEADWLAALDIGQRYLLSLGVTAWQDASVVPEFERAYRVAAGSALLRARVVGALWWERDRDEGQLGDLVERMARGPVGRYTPSSVKLMLDGVAENFTAAMLEPYLDGAGQPSDRVGLDFLDPAALPRYVTLLDAAGFQVHFHAIGDRAVRGALDAVEAARRANGWSDRRHHIAHIQVIHPDDIPRFRRLGVVANAQPLWAQHEDYQRDLTIPFLGEPRWRWQYPFRSLLRSGTTLAIGSDWSVSTPDPWRILEVAVRRVNPDRRHHEPFLPDERLDLAEALAAATIGSAFVNHLDAETGSIEVGKLADFAVVDRNPFEVLEAIGDTVTDLTVIEGEVVYERAP